MTLSRGFRLFVILSVFLAAAANAQQTLNLTLQLPSSPGLTAFIHVDVYESAAPKPSDATVMLVHGFAQTAASMGPLANALLAQGKVARVIVPDLPNHGFSFLRPDWGRNTLDDFVGTVDGVLTYFDRAGTPVDVLIGHSMGGLLVQLEQQSLTTAGSSLRTAHNVQSVVLIAPVIPSPLPWVLADSGTAATILAPYLDFGMNLDPRIIIRPPDAWRALFYSDLGGTIPAAAPTTADVVAAHYLSAESGFAGFKMIGYGAFGPRPQVDPDIFKRANGTTLGLITLGQDGFFSFAEHQSLYRYLTGDLRDKLLFAITGPNSVHNMHTFDTNALLKPIKKITN